MSDLEQQAVYRFAGELRGYLRTLPPEMRPDGQQVQQIVEQSEGDVRSLARSLEENGGGVVLADWWGDITKPFRELDKTACILANVAVGAAILAAWVASGGTLAIGSVVAGVTVTQPILAALTGGASGRVIAEILC